MKILRLELFGFKSFKDKTIITFDQAITAIVGSNGCGKSNVVDALYWVMGDMSPKHLRGSNMTDVIFSGSRDAAPLDMAEVTLVLERDPEKDPELPPQFQGSNEIQITRRYYRNGEGEYFINKVSCRLRDIQEFFMDTGLGAKAYSIIEQGAIMRMVTQKPEERRVVIEEVAGVMKFKARKAETERKLEHAATNLARIDDIVKDLQKQLTSLKRQAEKAEKYKLLSDELRHLEIRLASREWMSRTQLKSTSLLQVSELSVKHQNTEREVEKLRLRVEEARTELQCLEDELQSRRQNTRQLELSLKDTESKIATLQARRESLSRRLGQDRSNLEEIEQRQITLAEEILNLQNELTEIRAQSDELHSKAEAAAFAVQEIRTNTEALRKEVEVARKQVHSEELEETRLTQQVQEQQRNLAQLSTKQDSLKLQLTSIDSDQEMRDAERQGTLDFLELAFSKRSDLESEKTAVDTELAELDSKRGELQQKRDEIKRELTVVQIRKEQLEVLEKDLEGVNATSRTLALYLREKGVHETLLADTVKVPALLEKAVEAVLGRHLQRVLAPSYDSVEELQSVLANSPDQEAKQGRSSMWLSSQTQRRSSQDLSSIYLSAGPVEEVPGPDGLIEYKSPALLNAKDYLLNHPEVIGPMAAIIKNESGDAAWLNLVQDFWVLRSKESFAKVHREMGTLPISFVSLDGDVLSQDGYLDLAPIEATSEQGVGLVQRKREILELAAKASDLETKLMLAQADFDLCLKSLSLAKEKFQDLTARLSSLNPDVEKHSLLLRQVEAQVARLMEKKQILSEDLERSLTEHGERSLRLQEISEKIGEVSIRRGETLDHLQFIEEKLQVATDAQVEKENELQVIQRMAKDSDQKLSGLRSRLAAAEQEETLSKSRQVQIQEEIGRLDIELSDIQSTYEQDAQLRGQQQVELESAIEDTEDYARSVDKKKKESIEEQKSLERQSIESQTLAVALKDIEQSLAVNDVELKNIAERLQNQYQIALETLDDDKIKELTTATDIEEMADPETAKKHASTLRNRIDNLGKINMVAIEEFEEVSKRHEYLFIQRQDVHDGISQLKDAIDKIDRESRHRFAEAFTAVNTAFQTTFPVLFGGGNAELRLTNPDNLLETGVEIVAQPPGKKLQSVTLLSGGEKALTAVSLIFGIFSIKPSPFCVLDEVDAPLDDSNVNRFNSQVRRMAQGSQMILITHHKKTMESCDALFGVTMEQPGISKVASAKLGELRGSA